MAVFLAINILILSIIGMICTNSSIVVIGTGICIVICLTVKTSTKNWLHLSIISSILLLAVIILYFGYLDKYNVPYYIGGSDDLDFETYAELCIEYGYYTPLEVFQHFYWYVAKGYVWIVSCFMRLGNAIGEYHTLLPRIANVYCLLIIGVVAQKYCVNKLNFSHSKSRVVLYSITLFPNAIYICANLFRDVWVLMCIFLVFYIVDLELYKKHKVLWSCVIIILSLFAFFLRSQSIVIILLEIGVIYILKKPYLSKKTAIIYFLCACFVLLISPFIFTEIIDYTSYYREYLVNQQEGMSQVVFNFPLFPIGIVLRALYGLVSPFPNGILDIGNMFIDIDSFFNVLIAFGTIVQIVFLPFLLLSFRKIRSFNISYLINFLTIIVTTFTFRHFLILYPFMWISIWNEYYSVNHNIKKLCFAISFSCLLIFGMLYVVL